jgi:hypothetical protein
VFDTPDKITKNWKRSPAPKRIREINPRIGPVRCVSFGRDSDVLGS